MTTKKTTAKKTAAKKAPAKKAATKRVPKITLQDTTMYVVSKRTRMFFWEPVQVFPTYALASEYRDAYEEFSPYGPDGYKITKVDLVNAPIADAEVTIIP